MSSSRSEGGIQFVHLLVRTQGVFKPKEYQRCLKKVYRGYFKDISLILKEVSRVFQESFKGISGKIAVCFEDILKDFEECFKKN